MWLLGVTIGHISLIEVDEVQKAVRWQGSQYECYPESQTNPGMVYFWLMKNRISQVSESHSSILLLYPNGSQSGTWDFLCQQILLGCQNGVFRVAKTARSLFMVSNCQATKDGYDVQMQTNHLSHFLLTKESLNCRICRGAGWVRLSSQRLRGKGVEIREQLEWWSKIKN